MVKPKYIVSGAFTFGDTSLIAEHGSELLNTVEVLMALSPTREVLIKQLEPDGEPR